jgi:hypothetical protein
MTRNFTLLNVINYQDFLYGISLPDIHLDLVFINDVLIYQTLCPITLILQLPRYHRKPFLGGTKLSQFDVTLCWLICFHSLIFPSTLSV